MIRQLLITVFFTAMLMACAEQLETERDPCAGSDALEGPCGITSSVIRMNDLQAVGSHNSYKLAIPTAELNLIRQASEEAAVSLDYTHVPITEQLDIGMRQLELDVFYDLEGGRYATPALPIVASQSTHSDPVVMNEPGFKVMHIQDIDFRSNCLTFTVCLSEIKAWSDIHPDHVPILILINAKDAELDFPGTVTPIPFDSAAFAALDEELLSVFPREQLVTPDDVRGNAKSLREGVLENGWPRLEAARGKVMFVLDETPEKVGYYLRGKPSLEGLPMFVNSAGKTVPHAAYFTINDPIGAADRIASTVKAGFIIRTRADANTQEARLNDTRRRDAALASGAQYVSTDYYYPREEWSDYQVRLSGDMTARCNPVIAEDKCIQDTE